MSTTSTSRSKCSPHVAAERQAGARTYCPSGQRQTLHRPPGRSVMACVPEPQRRAEMAHRRLDRDDRDAPGTCPSREAHWRSSGAGRAHPSILAALGALPPCSSDVHLASPEGERLAQSPQQLFGRKLPSLEAWFSSTWYRAQTRSQGASVGILSGSKAIPKIP